MNHSSHILIIKHGALGDIVIATAGFAAIRSAYPSSHIVCLTTKPYANLLAAAPYFNEIWVDSKPHFSARKAVRRLREMLHSYDWSLIVDLQGSKRSTLYQWLLRRPWPPISNISRFSKFSCRDPERKYRHAYDNMQRQLAIMGLTVGAPDISWLAEDISGLLPETTSYVLLVPGGAPHRPAKRWPADHYAALAKELIGKKILPVLIGTNAEETVLEQIAQRVPETINLMGKTTIAQLASLARGAAYAVGNDTGPMHVIAGAGCRSLVLFSHDSDPKRCAPIGAVSILRRPDLADLSVDEVLAAMTGGIA